ncbi:MAG: toll/interleukin-1 receptor domain-containing protein [Pseudomonadota bacterium]
MSYATDDGLTVAGVATALRSAGVDAFYAKESIQIGEEWLPRLRNEIIICEGLVCFLSRRSVSSSWLNVELGAAWALGKPIFPVLIDIDPSDAHDIVKMRQCYPLSTDQAVEHLALKVASHLGINQNPIDAPDDRVYNFLDINNKEKLIAIGNWILGEGNDPIVGEGPNKYLISDRPFTPPYHISCELAFNNFSDLRPFNSGIIFGWEAPDGMPLYYNLLINQEAIWLELIGSRGGAAHRDFKHIGKRMKNSLFSGQIYKIEIDVLANTINAHIDGPASKTSIFSRSSGSLDYRASLDIPARGHVGFRPWAAEVTCHKYEVRPIS